MDTNSQKPTAEIDEEEINEQLLQQTFQWLGITPDMPAEEVLRQIYSNPKLKNMDNNLDKDFQIFIYSMAYQITRNNLSAVFGWSLE